MSHATFRDLDRSCGPGDLVVVNTSATLPAAVDGPAAGGRPVIVHFSAELDDGSWVVELRRPDNTGRGPGRPRRAKPSPSPAGASSKSLSAYRGVEGPEPAAGGPAGAGGSRWRYLQRGSAARSPTATCRRRPPLSDYQTVFATDPGSAEMPSAGRPFSDRAGQPAWSPAALLSPRYPAHRRLLTGGGEPPPAERFRVPATTARLVNHTRRQGGRVIAVGTTVTRALESAADENGVVGSAQGWTDLVLERPAGSSRRRADHRLARAASATHLMLLESVAGEGMLHRAYTRPRCKRATCGTSSETAACSSGEVEESLQNGDLVAQCGRLLHLAGGLQVVGRVATLVDLVHDHQSNLCRGQLTAGDLPLSDRRWVQEAGRWSGNRLLVGDGRQDRPNGHHRGFVLVLHRRDQLGLQDVSEVHGANADLTAWAMRPPSAAEPTRSRTALMTAPMARGPSIPAARVFATSSTTIAPSATSSISAGR